MRCNIFEVTCPSGSILSKDPEICVFTRVFDDLTVEFLDMIGKKENQEMAISKAYAIA